jgi:hypothetical protein
MPIVLPSDDVVTTNASTSVSDVEKQQMGSEDEPANASKTSAFKSLGWLDRFLA